MSDEEAGLNIAEVLREAALSATVLATLPQSSTQADEFVERLRARTRRSSTECPSIDRLTPDNRRRLNTVVYLEDVMSADDDLDYAPLILAACQIVEDELGRSLSAPSRHAHAVLREAVVDSSIADVVHRWLDGRLPLTMGSIQALCVAWRRADESAGVAEGLLTREYVRWIRTRGPERALARLRDQYRNPAAHAARTFSADDFSEIAALLVGSASFGAWVVRGLTPPVPADRALIHHHLLLAYRTD